jgi:hypothetical protein
MMQPRLDGEARDYIDGTLRFNCLKAGIDAHHQKMMKAWRFLSEQKDSAA